jgi:predicted ferric reductase
MKIDQVVRESSDATSLYLRGKNIHKLGGAAGQFYFLRVLTPTRWFKAHPFSLSAAPNNHFMRFTIGNRGDDTSFLQNIKPGTRVAVEGPFGVFTEERRTKEKVVLIASGIGIPPIRALAESMAARPGDITIIYRVRNEEDASLLTEVREIARIRGFRLYVLPGPRAGLKSWMNNDGTNNPDLARLAIMAPWISESDVYICGPQIWTELVVSSVTRSGVPADRIHAEEFAW